MKIEISKMESIKSVLTYSGLVVVNFEDGGRLEIPRSIFNAIAEQADEHDAWLEGLKK